MLQRELYEFLFHMYNTEIFKFNKPLSKLMLGWWEHCSETPQATKPKKTGFLQRRFKGGTPLGPTLQNTALLLEGLFHFTSSFFPCHGSAPCLILISFSVCFQGSAYNCRSICTHANKRNLPQNPAVNGQHPVCAHLKEGMGKETKLANL